MSRFQNEITIEDLAEVIHESARESVKQNALLNPNVQSTFVEWKDLPEKARQGKIIMAKYIHEHYRVIPQF